MAKLKSKKIAWTLTIEEHQNILHSLTFKVINFLKYSLKLWKLQNFLLPKVSGTSKYNYSQNNMRKLLETTLFVLNFTWAKLWQLAKVSKFLIVNFANCYNIEMLRLLIFFWERQQSLLFLLYFPFFLHQ